MSSTAESAYQRLEANPTIHTPMKFSVTTINNYRKLRRKIKRLLREAIADAPWKAQ
jgi:hypothetical protein